MPTPTVLLCKENAPEKAAQGIKSSILKAPAAWLLWPAMKQEPTNEDPNP
jgi:hypothetical protein